ncbi:hypothetical protein VaNZ11_012416 [Volvox africanus]|uniref:Uncharacterized protein n=1 Tax=Volvox africanus TaxID=51714 RepID=A0ABQ5SDU7_9CHLO|nr:hypothetical protein VaNZ11_012416 [Volvox africanus]
MSKGIPISQRPDLKDACLSTRLDAVFGSLGPPAAAGGWSLRQDIQPFKAGGGIEEYNYSSDEEDPNEGLKPLMPSQLVDSDDENGCDASRDPMPQLERADPDADAEEAGLGREQSEARAARERERMRATLSSRRAFEAEAEEDEYDRVATGTMDLRNRLRDAKPPGFTEVPLDSAWERMHGRWQQQGEEQQQEMDIRMPDTGLNGVSDTAAAMAPTEMDSSPVSAGDGGKGSGAAASRKRGRSGAAAAALWVPVEQQHLQAEQQHRVQLQQSGYADVEMMQATTAGGSTDPDAPGDVVVVDYDGGPRIASDTRTSRSGISSLASGAGSAIIHEPSGPATAPPVPSPQPPRQRGGRRVQWADFASGRSSDVDSTPAGNGFPNGHVNGSNGHTLPANGGSGRGGGDDGGARGRGHGGGQIRLDWQRRGFVPDHVRNPHKYIMYTLDEELVVGGGDRSTNNRNGRNGRNGGMLGGGGGGNGRLALGEDREGENEMRQGLAQARQAVEAASLVEHDPERVETTFGSGIAFRPRAARQQELQPRPRPQEEDQPSRQHGDSGERGPPDGVISGVLGISRGVFVMEGDEVEGPGNGEDAVASRMNVMRSCTRRGGGQRHFRARPRQTDEDDWGRDGGLGDDEMQQDERCS